VSSRAFFVRKGEPEIRARAGTFSTKKGDAAWEDCVACLPVTVLTPVTENREQEVMLSSPVSLAPREVEQYECHVPHDTHSGYDVQRFDQLILVLNGMRRISTTSARVKNTLLGLKYLL
jgi:hypothetical protein